MLADLRPSPSQTTTPSELLGLERLITSYDPWVEADRAGIRIAHVPWGCLPRDVYGFARISQRMVVLTDGLTDAEARCTLTHEILHVERGQAPDHLIDAEEALIERLTVERLLHTERLYILPDLVAHLGEEAAADLLSIDRLLLDSALRMAVSA